MREQASELPSDCIWESSESRGKLFGSVWTTLTQDTGRQRGGQFRSSSSSRGCYRRKSRRGRSRRASLSRWVVVGFRFRGGGAGSRREGGALGIFPLSKPDPRPSHHHARNNPCSDRRG